MKKSALLLIFVLALVVTGWLLFGMNSDVEVIDSLVDDRNDEIIKPIDAVIQQANLKPVGTYVGSGTATSVYSLPKGPFNHMVSAEISDPVEGKFYEGWLVGGFGFVSTGKMVKVGDKYTLEFESGEDMTSYGKVVITEETLANGLDGNPEAHVLEGSF